MIEQVLGVVALVLACAVGIWKLFGRKAKEKRERIDTAKKQFEEGVAEDDPSKITAGFGRIKRDS